MPQKSKTPKLCTLQMAGLYHVSEDYVVLTYFWRRLRCGLVDLGRLTMEGTTSNDDIVVTGKSVNILKAAVLSVA